MFDLDKSRKKYLSHCAWFEFTFQTLQLIFLLKIRTSLYIFDPVLKNFGYYWKEICVNEALYMFDFAIQQIYCKFFKVLKT